LKKNTRALFLTLCILFLSISTAKALEPSFAVLFGSGGGDQCALELDGVFVGWLTGAAGGNAIGDVVQDKETGLKHIGNVKYEDFSVQLGLNMSPVFWEWITATMNRKYERKNGALVITDSKYKEKSRREFSDGLITAIQFPKLAAKSKEKAHLGVTFSISKAKEIKGSGKPYAQKPPKHSHTQAWLIGNYRLKIEGLEAASANVEWISKSVFQSEFSDLEIALPESDGDDFIAWHEDFVINEAGKTQDGKSATLEYLSTDGQPLLTLKFSNLGIFSRRTISDFQGTLLGAAQADAGRRLIFGFYSGRIDILPNGSL
jgi:hypothetical protein